LSFVISFLSFVSAVRTFFFSSKLFLVAGTSSVFFLLFFLSLSLSLFQQQHKHLVHKTLEQIDAQINGIFRTAPSTNMGQSFRWQQG
jgi:hypothetical protein